MRLSAGDPAPAFSLPADDGSTVSLSDLASRRSSSSDEDHAAAEAYGVWVQKSMYGRTFMGVERSTVVIGPDGTLAEAFYGVRPKGHAASVLELIGPAG